MYSFFDLKSESFTPPMCYSNDQEFTRFSIDHVLRDGKSLISQHPEDFRLFQVGEFDTTTGLCTMTGLILIGDLLPFVRAFTAKQKELLND